MSGFGKVTQMLGQLAQSHDMANATARKGAAKTDVQVQALLDGFWCVVHEAPTVALAEIIARSYHEREKAQTRVVVGPKREVRMEFKGA